MNAERLQISRRFVACPKWAWLPGMLDERGRRVVEVRGRKVHFSDGTWCDCDSTAPDLDDDLTRLGGLLAVVRLAWDDPTMSLQFCDRTPLDGVWRLRGRWTCTDDTEEMTLFRGLEAAP